MIEFETMEALIVIIIFVCAVCYGLLFKITDEIMHEIDSLQYDIHSLEYFIRDVNEKVEDLVDE